MLLALKKVNQVQLIEKKSTESKSHKGDGGSSNIPINNNPFSPKIDKMGIPVELELIKISMGSNSSSLLRIGHEGLKRKGPL